MQLKEDVFELYLIIYQFQYQYFTYTILIIVLNVYLNIWV